jgi:hypothetical protein
MEAGLNPAAALNEVMARIGGQQADSRLRNCHQRLIAGGKAPLTGAEEAKCTRAPLNCWRC